MDGGTVVPVKKVLQALLPGSRWNTGVPPVLAGGHPDRCQLLLAGRQQPSTAGTAVFSSHPSKKLCRPSKKPRRPSKKPRCRSKKPRRRSKNPRHRSKKPCRPSKKPRCRSKKPRRRSKKPRRRGKKPRASGKSRKAGAESGGKGQRGAFPTGKGCHQGGSGRFRRGRRGGHRALAVEAHFQVAVDVIGTRNAALGGHLDVGIKGQVRQV